MSTRLTLDTGPNYFQRVNHDNKSVLNRQSDSNAVYYSELSNFYIPNAFRSFSIKYVLAGTATYQVGKKIFKVKPGFYLLGNRQPSVNGYLSIKKVKAICIDVDAQTLAEAFTVLKSKGNVEFDNLMASYFRGPDFFENIYSHDNSTLGLLLQRLASNIQRQNKLTINREWFFDIVEQLVIHEHGNDRAIANIGAVKSTTRKELLSRLKQGESFINDNYLRPIQIKEMADFASLSEFHFHRVFKMVYRISPLQFLISKRLVYAREQLLTSKKTITEISSMCGYVDVPTFSKSFKKKFGIPPTELRKELEAP